MPIIALHGYIRDRSRPPSLLLPSLSTSERRKFGLVIGRILGPASKLATARALSPTTAASSLGDMLGLGEVDEDELYAALDWLLERQPVIEAALAKRHLTNGTLVLYDVSSSYMEGRCCPLAQRGYSRDGKKGTLQVIYGLLCAADGCPVAIEVFDGDTADPMTLANQVEKLKQRFQLDHVVMVGDRGMITQARITSDIKAAGLDWITTLRAPAIKVLLETGALQLSLFDQRDLASITAPEFPGERLIVCRNPDLASERRRKREDLLAATEQDLSRIQIAVARRRNPLRGVTQIALAVGAVINKHKVGKHFAVEITDTAFSFARKTAAITAEAAADGVYVVRTSLPEQALDDAAAVRSYKSLALVERAFRCLKTVDLQIRPVHHWLADRVRAHVFLCMLASHGVCDVKAGLSDHVCAPLLGSAVRAPLQRRRHRAPRHLTSGRRLNGGRTIIRYALGVGLGKAEPNY